ncbi:periplasmic heavy metal sensor [Mesorhizobium sp. KR9-304]|uniref:periplasmic heavy metal sensor n=1 Tax=Mesorhizobium sp. KR9-304 TaxID=3156614 RepID=UPI0032B37065
MTRRSWLQIFLVTALAISVIANFFLLGFIVKASRTGLGGGIVAEALVGAYPQEVRSEFRRLLKENRTRTRAALRELRQARRNVAEASKATPYVEADVERAMERVRAATDELQRMMQGLLLEALRNTRQAV